MSGKGAQVGEELKTMAHRGHVVGWERAGTARPAYFNTVRLLLWLRLVSARCSRCRHRVRSMSESDSL